MEDGFDVAYSNATGTAEATDFTVAGASLSFAGTLNETKTIDVTIKGDDIVEDNDGLVVCMENCTGLKPILEDPSRPKGGQNVKYDALVLAHHGIEVQGIAFDTLLESYLLSLQRSGALQRAPGVWLKDRSWVRDLH